MSNPLFTMSFTELDSKINDGLDSVATLVPYLQEMRERLHSQGKRTDLPDTPKGMTWTAWVASKKSRLKMSIRTVQRVLEGPRTSRQVDAKSVFEELASRLNALVPSLSDGVEHKTVSLLQQAPESVTSDLNETGTLHLEEVIYLLETVSQDFAAYAKELRSAADTSALTLPTRFPTRHGRWAPQVADDKFAEVV